jgi:protein-serine/threonine kinase
MVLNSSYLDGLPGRPGSAFRWGGGLRSHPEIQENEDQDPSPLVDNHHSILPPRVIMPSLATLEKAVAARIYFENLYFPLFRHPNSREERKKSMEKDMTDMGLTLAQKEHLRARWRQNETEYLRERRQKVDASAFVKLKTIGHGWIIYHRRRSSTT